MAETTKTQIFKLFLVSVRQQLYLFIGMAVVFASIFILGNLPVTLYIYSIQLSLFFFAIYLIIQYIRYSRRFKAIKEVGAAQSTKAEDVADGTDPADRLYLEKIGQLQQDIRNLTNLHAERQADQLDYFTLWLHQIKTPLSAISLLNQSSVTSESRKISQEILRLEDYTHMALNYVKLEETGSDMELSEVDLDVIIKKAIKKYSILFIYKGIKLDYEPLGVKVLSDGQWLQTLLEQILSNSLKYTAAGTITIYMDSEKNQTLIIKDTGAGIRSEDLPKIFNKGYSGLSGRLHEKSTGLGLFLSRKIGKRLGHKLSIESEPGKGTRVKIDLEKQHLSVFD
ncbi:sensor histidine kinase [Jeotgalibacillus terrae]|uniref:histidine kinase n=1 Tax=Jeotgalibacillus terrae TaxID=587735 RepID=A0ABW5ZM83_9BACL|nr:sensor histidine kinase [Jeotgalibacillus terrae]MBM7578237.1 signal transduction histidine kinase [Jeotgalibacillus terrae]